MAGTNDLQALARLLGLLYTEVFQRKANDPNKPLNQSNHIPDQLIILDTVKSVQIPDNLTYVWGPAGTSGEAPATLFGYRLSFNGINDDVTIADQAAIQNIFDSGGTAEFRVYAKSDGESNLGVILDKRIGWRVNVQGEASGKVRVRLFVDFDSTDGQWVTTVTELTLNEWHRVSVVFDSDSVSNNPVVYIDGVSVAVTESTTPVGTRVSDVGQEVVIGGDGSGGRTWDGYIDDVRLWSDIRTAQEISDNYQKELVGTEAGLVGYWKFNEGTGSSTLDSSPNSNAGTITGASWNGQSEIEVAPRWSEVGIWA